jgi:hypothetical protein
LNPWPDIPPKVIKLKCQKEIIVNYEDKVVGNCIATIFVEDSIILELKSAKKWVEIHIST